MPTIDERCQEIAKDMQRIVDGKLRIFNSNYREKIQGRIEELIEDLTKKQEHHRDKIREVVYFLTENYFILDFPPIEMDEGNRVIFLYNVDNTNGFRRVRYRPKLISRLSSKITRNFLLRGSELGEEERKYAKNIRDVVAFRVIADNPDAPAVDFISLYDTNDTKVLLEFIEEHKDRFETKHFIYDNYVQLSKEGFKALFDKFKEIYASKYEKQNKKALYDLAEFIQKEINKIGFDMMNVSDLPMMYRHHNVRVASQDFFYVGDTTGKLVIYGDIIVFGDEKTATDYLTRFKSSFKSDKGSKSKWSSLGSNESPNINQGLHITNASEGYQTIVVRKRNVVIGFRGSAKNERFAEEVLGSRKRKGFVNITLADVGEKKDVSATILRISFPKVPGEYLANHYTNPKVFLDNYGLKESSLEPFFFKDYLKYPRGGVYGALHGVIIEQGESEFKEPIDIQLRTSLGNFEAERGNAKVEDYDRLKEERVDLKNKKILPGVKSSRRKLLNSFINQLIPGMIVGYYKSRINSMINKVEKSLEQIDESVLIEKGVPISYISKKIVNELIPKFVREYQFLKEEFPERDFSKIKERIELIPCYIVGKEYSPSRRAINYLNGIAEELTRKGFDAKRPKH